MFIGPFVPDRHPMIVEILDIGIAGEEPEQLVDDRLEVQLLGRRQRKALAEVESHLFPEYRQRADSRAVVLFGPANENSFNQIKVLAHARDSWPARTRFECRVYRPCCQR